MPADPNLLVLVGRLLLALALGGAIGLERERHERAAGLRTVTMVSLGSCLFTLMSLYGFLSFSSTTPGNFRADPSRVAAQIVTGIGFLGAGTIFLRKDLVRGLTTAATIWATAAIGMASAAGQYFAACFTTLLVLVVLMVLKPVEARFFKRSEEATFSLVLPRSPDSLDQVRASLRAVGAFLQTIQLQEVSESEDRIEMEVEVPPKTDINSVLNQLRGLKGVRQILLSQELSEDRARMGT